MTIWFHRYTLVPRAAPNARASAAPREGALLRIGDGFADLHPWPELGDLPLDEQLALLARGETSAIIARSMRFAAEDAAARRRGVSLFEGAVIPPSHWTRISGEPVPDGFDTVKLKLRAGDRIDPELSRYRLRLDFNGTLDRDPFLQFLGALPAEIREAIEFVEDPLPYDAAIWRELRRCVRLAADRAGGDEEADVLVIKPALQDVPATGKELVITSNMDHPVGQCFAALIASRHADRARRCGLITHPVFEPNAFSERLGIDGMRLVPPRGSGIGFDDLLEGLSWARLR